jgi:hypothetical protein
MATDQPKPSAKAMSFEGDNSAVWIMSFQPEAGLTNTYALAGWLFPSLPS